MNKRKITPNPAKRTEREFLQMVVSLICLAIVTVIAYIYFERNVFIPVIGAVVFLLSVLTPLIVRFLSYHRFFSSANFIVTNVVKSYSVNANMKGYYKLLDAIRFRTLGETEKALISYNDCLSMATDSQMKKACYLEYTKYYPTSVEVIPDIKEACKLFPEETSFFYTVTSYYIWAPMADKEEGLEWINDIAENGPEELRYRAVFRLGVNKMLEGSYAEALELFFRAKELCKCIFPPYMLMDISVCLACLKRYDEAREYAILTAASVDYNSEEIDIIREKLDYVFKATSGEINHETEKLITELKRREDAAHSETMTIGEIKERRDENYDLQR